MKLGDWLEKKKITHEDFAARIGKDRSAVTRYVSGERMPGRTTLALIASETNGDVTANDFVGLGEQAA